MKPKYLINETWIMHYYLFLGWPAKKFEAYMLRRHNVTCSMAGAAGWTNLVEWKGPCRAYSASI